jgi:hypothetical protein
LQLIIAPIKVHPDARLQSPSVTSCHMSAPSLFVSHRVTLPGEYADQIEGPAADKSGNLYVVNFHSAGTIGKVAPGASHSTLFATLHHGRTGSGIRFDRQGACRLRTSRKTMCSSSPRARPMRRFIFTPTISSTERSRRRGQRHALCERPGFSRAYWPDLEDHTQRRRPGAWKADARRRLPAPRRRGNSSGFAMSGITRAIPSGIGAPLALWQVLNTVPA